MRPSNDDEDSSTGAVEQMPACVSCSKSKRRCSRQVPSCRRCRVQKRRCVYPATARRIMPHPASSPQASLSASDAHTPNTEPPAVQARPSTTTPSSLQLQSLGPGDLERHLAHPWFLVPSSWDIDHIPESEDDRIHFPNSGLDFFLDKVRTWLDQFSRENHCAFIHSGLYGPDLPSPLQHALAAWQVYRAATTPTSRTIALRMASDWSRNLVNEVFVADSLTPGTVPVPGFADRLGRVQALLVYQLIGFFDGDVRARAYSEEILATLTTWADALLLSAAVEVDASTPLGSPPRTLPNVQPQNNSLRLRSDGTPASAWRSWIRAESARRVWVVATLIECAFLIMKQGFATCPGGIYITAKEGLWNAKNARAWTEAISERPHVQIPTHMRQLDVFLASVAASDVDEFTHTIFIYGRGTDALQE